MSRHEYQSAETAPPTGVMPAEYFKTVLFTKVELHIVAAENPTATIAPPVVAVFPSNSKHSSVIPRHSNKMLSRFCRPSPTFKGGR